MTENDPAASFRAFIQAESVASIDAAWKGVLNSIGEESKLKGTAMYERVKTALLPKLNFKEKGMFTELDKSLVRRKKLASDQAGSVDLSEFKILICGAGPVGLRTAVEACMLGFDATVVEKRPDFSRANVLTFWDETMADFVGLGAKALDVRGGCSFVGFKYMSTKFMQEMLLKVGLLFGLTVHYGHEISGLQAPEVEGARWTGVFRPYVKGKRADSVEEQLKAATATEEDADGKDAAAAEAALDFCKPKDYATASGKHGGSAAVDPNENNELDPGFLLAAGGAAGEAAEAVQVGFDAYLVAEGGWSDNTKKLGFSKVVAKYKPVFGLVVNLDYDPSDAEEKKMRSFVSHCMSKEFPLQKTRIMAEFVEYLKTGQNHYIALVVNKSNPTTPEQIEYMREGIASGNLTADVERTFRDNLENGLRGGLLELGVFKECFGSGARCLVSENLSMERLYAVAKDVMQEIGLPADKVKFCESNPVQLFDFSRRAHCRTSCVVLENRQATETLGGGPDAVQAEEFLAAGAPSSVVGRRALVMPLGDALQEPNWTEGVGLNRGIHSGFNAVFACLLAASKGPGDETAVGLKAAVKESITTYREKMVNLKWGGGNTGLAGSGCGLKGLKPGNEWTAAPKTRLP
eukprot:CAMPEP_0197872620 /NCGR_PEP_ID=MMETSP1439-20131203/2666_1 /TAXON_ID=66791 /ORGANISM="Gonyaulax spinifera, Strain CCMP409" /LENGTH=633 /DNA_ID=CAMNT_0043491623 /DNA_START=47 /DNA_END=1948 /DNA_ORIENTATION=+